MRVKRKVNTQRKAARALSDVGDLQIAGTANGGQLMRLFVPGLGWFVREDGRRPVPRTAVAGEQKPRSFEPIELWWLARPRDGALYQGEWPPELTCSALFEDYAAAVGKIASPRRRAEIAFGRKLGKLLSGLLRRMRITGAGGKRVWCYQLPPIKRAREQFKSTLSRPLDWSLPWEELILQAAKP